MKPEQAELMRLALTAFASDFKSTGNAVVDCAIQHIYLTGFGRGGQVSADQIMKKASASFADVTVDRIMRESK